MSASFPRGGENASGGQVSGHKRANDENIFGGSQRTKRMEVFQAPKKKKTGDDFAGKANSTAPSLTAIGLGMTKKLDDNKTLKIDPVTFSKLNTGCLVIGYVLQVSSDRVIVSLPGSSTGMVAHHEISDVLYKMKMSRNSSREQVTLPDVSTLVAPLQMVRCYVLDQVAKSEGAANSKKIIRLSMRASLINRGLSMKHVSLGFPLYGCIASKEDHGYVVSAGINGTNFFLPLKALPSNKQDLQIGQPVECVCAAVNDGAQSATLRAHPKAVYEALTRSGNLAFTSLVPGMLVNVVIDKKVENGVLVNFLGMFYGVIDTSSFARPYAGNEWTSAMNEGDTMHARIVLVDQATKSIRLSLRPHVLEMRAPRNLPALGDVVEDLTVLSVQKTAGVLLSHSKSAADSDEMDVDDEEDAKTDKEGNKKRKAIAQALKQQREKDEAVLAVFVNKSSLAASTDHEDEESAEVIDPERISKVYKVGNAIASVRVKGYNLVEGWAIATNMVDFVEGTVVHASDVKVGQLLAVTVSAIMDFGLIVHLGGASGKVTAVCPTFHSADVVVEGKLRKKFKVDQELTMRVWEVSSSGIIMTNKKTMVDLAEDAVVANYSGNDTDVGKIVTGVVSNVNAQGIQVRFFNKVRGTVPMSVLVQQGVLNPDEAYRPGQILRSVVIGKSLPAQGETTGGKAMLFLGLNMSKDISTVLKMIDGVSVPSGTITYASASTGVKADSSNGKKSQASSTTAVDTEGDTNQVEFVSGSIFKIEDDAAQVRLDNGKVAKLPKHHFYDLASTAEGVYGAAESDIKVGMRVEDALVLSYTKGVAVITLKPLLVFAAKVASGKVTAADSSVDSDAANIAIPNKIADLTPGQVLAGFIVKVDAFGVIVRFRGNLSALAPRPNIADKFTPTAIGIFTAGDSVRCVVQRVDMTTEKTVVTLKPSIVTPSAGPINYLSMLLREQYTAAVVASHTSKKLFPNWQKYAVGSVVKATVTSLESYGVILTADDNSTMLLARDTSAERLAELSVGKSVKARVLDIDFANSVLEVSLESAFIKTAEASSKDKKASTADALTEGTKCDAQVALVKSNYLVVLVKKSLGYVMLSDYHNPKPDISAFKVHQKITVKVQSAPAESTSAAYPHATVAVLTVFEESGANDHRSHLARMQKEAEESDSKAASGDLPIAVIKQRFVDKLRVGQLIQWVVSEVNSQELKVVPEHHEEMGLHIKATVHVSGAIDPYQNFDNLHKVLKKAAGIDRSAVNAQHPFHGLTEGSKVWCHVLQVRRETSVKNKETLEEFMVYLSLSVSSNLASISKMGLSAAATDARPTKADGTGYLPFHRMLQSHGKDELKCPSMLAVVVTKIEEVGCIVALTPYLTTRLNFVDVSNDPELIEQFMNHCFVGLRLVVVVTSLSKDDKRIRNMRVSRALIETMANDSDKLFDVTRSRNKVNDGTINEPVYEEGQVVNAMLNLHIARVPKPPAIALSLPGQKLGRVCVTEIWDKDEWQDLSELQQKISVARADSEDPLSLPDGRPHGKIVQARVLSVTDGFVELSLRPSRVSTTKISAALKPDAIPTEGSIIPVYVANASNLGCYVRLSSTITGKVLMRDLSDEFIQKPEEVFPVGKLCQARLLSISQIDNEAKLSLKDSVVIGDQKARKEIEKIKENSIMSGTVQRVTQDGVFVTLQGTSLTGLSRRAAAISDESKALSEEYEVGDVVRCKILKVSKISMKIALGLRAHYFKKSAQQSNDEAEDSEGESESADGDSDEEEEDDSAMDVSDNEASEDSGEVSEDAFCDGNDDDDEEEGSEDEEEDSDDDSENNIRMLEEGEDTDSEVERMIKGAALASGSEDEDQSESDSEASDAPPAKKAPASKKAAAAASTKKAADSDDSDSDGDVKVSSLFGRNAGGVFGKKAGKEAAGGLQWDDSAPLLAAPASSARTVKETAQVVAEESSEEEDSVDEEGDGKGAGKSKLRSRQKESVRRKAEQDIRSREAALANGTLVPEHKDDFERMLIAQPNSSFLWVKYMAFHLQSADIDPARAVAARALRTIDYREEDEKFNVWIALINMEHKYGSMQTLENAFERAVAESKGKLIYLAMATTYEQAGDIAGAEAVFQKALKRPQYKKSKKVWMAYHQFKLRTGDADAAKAQLARSMQSLSRHKHVETISRYALAEFDYGSADRGRVVFEDLLTNYPKRSDLWHLYVDKEVKLGNALQARQLFERMITSKASARNMKAVFKKYLSFEITHGTETTQEAVKQKAREYVSSIA